jgi:hypothetical protein
MAISAKRVDDFLGDEIAKLVTKWEQEKRLTTHVGYQELLSAASKKLQQIFVDNIGK